MGWRYRILRFLGRELHRRFAEAFEDPRGAQAERLRAILARAAQSSFGKAHGFAEIRDIRAYRGQVPLVTYEELEPWVQRIARGEPGVLTQEDVGLFLRTSGSTGPAKLIPCTPGLEKETGDARAWWAACMVREDERNARGKHLNIYSPEVEGYTDGGIPYGSNTGRIRNRQPRLVRLNDPVPAVVFGLKDAATRYELILLFALAAADLGTFSTANPSTVLLLVRLLQDRGEALFEELEKGELAPRPGLAKELRASLGARLHCPRPRVRELRGLLRKEGRLAPPRVWPGLTTLNTWRCGGAEFYEPMLREWFDPIPIRDPGFSASEGFVAIPFTHRDPAGVLNVAGHFFEFLPADAPPAGGGEPTLLAHELETDMEVRPVLTTSGGLYRYDLGDVARVEGRHGNAPVLRFLHRAGRVLSITGEKVTEAQASEAAASACLHCDVAAADFCVGLELRDPPRYCLALEPAQPGPGQGARLDKGAKYTTLSRARQEALARAFDLALGEANVEYRSKRDSLRLAQARLMLLPEGAFGRLRREMVEKGAPDGQVKLPHLAMDFGLVEGLARRKGKLSLTPARRSVKQAP